MTNNNQNNNSSDSASSRQAPINLPSGGGAIRSIGEKFEVNPVTGTFSFTVPLNISPGRAEFTPQLSLDYDSGSGNSIFGLGWNMNLGNITRKTDKQLPQYNDNPNKESDTFILSGAEDLVPAMINGQRDIRETSEYKIYSYYPRTEGLFALIERWVHKTTFENHWRVVSRDNITSIYGFSASARIVDPDNNKRVFSWLLQESWDSLGNLIRYEYKSENGINVLPSSYENQRLKENIFSNKYIKKISYGNKSMCNPGDTQSNYTGGFHLSVVFDYGEHQGDIPSYSETGTWEARHDAFSTYRSCFDIRTYRLCKRVLMFHEFTVLSANPVLVKSTDLEYDISTTFTLLKNITYKGYKNNEVKSLPPLDFDYSKAEPDKYFKEVPGEQLKQMPAGIDNINYQWADFNAESLSGILSMDNNAWYYMQNYGDKKYLDPNSESMPNFTGYMEKVMDKPAAVQNNDTSYRFDDIDSDGLPELVIQGKTTKGFYTKTPGNKWHGLVSFLQFPNIDINADNVRFMDFTGEGMNDIVVSKGESFDIYFSLGKDGYASVTNIRCDDKRNAAPQILFSNDRQSIFLADMTGDGLTDIVRICNQGIEYWSNTGYGTFGDKINMSNAPLLCSQEEFDGKYIRLADVDGNGTTDMLFIRSGQIRYFKNLSGNAWQEEELSPALICNADSETFINLTDLLGNGTLCLTIGNNIDRYPRMQYLELTGGIKPFLLNKIDNSMGGITELEYAPSTKFYIRDKFQDKEWITKLPFVVHVLEKVIKKDLVSNTEFVNRYAYRHGYYDHDEREFRGFGMVEQWDSEEYKSGVNDALTVPPAHTKMWFHTGFFRKRNKISRSFEDEYYKGDENAWLLPDTILPENLSAEEQRQACRALKGSILRKEIYVQDGSDKENIPYITEEYNYKLSCLQNKGENKHGVFFNIEGEKLVYHYERTTNNPRILHTIVTQTDDYGNITRSAEIGYPQRTSSEKPLITFTINDFINNETGFRRIGLPYRTRNYQIHNYNYTGNKINDINIDSITEIDYAQTSPTTYCKRLIQDTKTYYWNEGLTQAAALGNCSAQALLHSEESLEFTSGLLTALNAEGTKFTATFLQNSKYKQDGTNWYKSGNINNYTANKFYQLTKVTDAFGNQTLFGYDTYNMYIVKVTDALNYETTGIYDYLVLQVQKITDPNGNSKEVSFDALGFVNKLVLSGKNGEGDTTDSPTEVYDYNLDSWKTEGKPVFSHVAKKLEHGDTNTTLIESYVYTDGFGNEIMTKTTATSGVAWTIVNGIPKEIASDNRWLSSGKKILNNKGDVVKEYEPWYSTTHEFEFEAQLTQYGVTPIFYYDGLGRLIQTDYPDNTTSRIEISVWEQKHYDRNDCDENSAHYNTPKTEYFDILGRVYKTVEDNKTVQFTTELELDIIGRVLRVKDIAGRYATTNIFALSEEYLVYTINIDSGKRWILNDIYGNINKYWDGKNYIRSIEYDVLLRPVKTKVTFGAVTQTFEHIIYGTNAGKNTIGQIEQIKSQDGITSFEYDFKGNVSKETKQFTQNYIDTINWDDNIVMQQESFVTIRQYNAINKLIRERTPDNTVVYHAYDRGGLLNFVEKTSGSNTYNYISNIEYNARLQREKVYYGNNTLTHLSYDKNTFRLIRLLTTRNNGNDILQDINYAYDNEGNIIRQKDDAQQTHYFNNTVIAPTSNYEYDSLYRLIKATGRELAALNIPDSNDFANNIPCPNSTANAMQNYTQLYEYDGLGNITKMQSQGNWTRNYVYETATNRLLKHGTGANEYDYDAQGNITAMPHLQSMTWDNFDRLKTAANSSFSAYYNYDNSGNRTRKVVIKDNIREERYYIGSYEVYRKYSNGSLDLERKTLNISDDEKVFVREETLNNTTNIRYQYDNHLGSACLELNDDGNIISYEEYHPFGTTSYRSGRNETEVSLKRYKYCGKERDEETGLYYYGARYYAAWLGRFVSVDSLQDEYPELTPYQYSNNNPISMIDIDGLEGVNFNDIRNDKNIDNTLNASNTTSTLKDLNAVGNELTNNIDTTIITPEPHKLDMKVYYRSELKNAETFDKKIEYGLKLIGVAEFEDKFIEKAEIPLTIIAQTMASFNPITTIANAYTIFLKQETIWGDEANILDVASTIAGLSSLRRLFSVGTKILDFIAPGLDFLNITSKEIKKITSDDFIIESHQQDTLIDKKTHIVYE